MMSVMVILLCFNCALTVCNMSQMLNFREVLVMLIDVLTEEEENED